MSVRPVMAYLSPLALWTPHGEIKIRELHTYADFCRLEQLQEQHGFRRAQLMKMEKQNRGREHSSNW